MKILDLAIWKKKKIDYSCIEKVGKYQMKIIGKKKDDCVSK